MARTSEYYDRLDRNTKGALIEILGGDLGWKRTFPRLSKEQKLEVGKIATGLDCKRVWLEFETNRSTGWDIPIICVEY